MNLKQVVINGEKLNVGGGSGGSSLSESLPIGSVIMWAGTLETIPTGWHLCNGEDGTIDLRGMFALGAGGTYNLGDEGGSEEVTLTASQMPEHTHYTTVPTVENTTGSTYYGMGVSNKVSSLGPQNIQSKKAGSSQPHPNMPPYKALYYIQKIT